MSANRTYRFAVLLTALLVLAMPAAASQSSVLYGLDYTPGGTYPYGKLTAASDGFLYGATSGGGTHLVGALFKISTGGIHTTLHQFDVTTGANPYGPPIEASDGNFYGVTFGGGAHSAGVLCRVTPTGSLTVVRSFGSFSGEEPTRTAAHWSTGERLSARPVSAEPEDSPH